MGRGVLAICSVVFLLGACSNETDIQKTSDQLTKEASQKITQVNDKAPANIKAAGFEHIFARDRKFPPNSFWACKDGKEYLVFVDKARKISKVTPTGRPCKIK